MSTLTKAAHTPGPWRAAEWSCHAPTTIVASGRTILPNGTLIIAECGGQGRDTDETLMADARLIAASPEMLEALEQTQAALVLYDGHVNNPTDRAGWTEESGYTAYMNAEAAIQKALGGQ